MTADMRTAVSVTEFDPRDEAAFTAVLDIMNTVVEHDVPDFPRVCRHRFRAQLDVPWPGQVALRWVARDGAEIVGYAQADLPTLDNLENAEVEISVRPRHRRRGVGRAMYEHIVAELRHRGRRRVMGFTPVTLPGGVERDPAGSAFAAAMGMSNALDDVRRRLDVSSVDDAVLDEQLANAWTKAAGYSLVRWANRTPEEHLADVALLDSRLVTDAPMGDLAWEAEKVDSDRIRASDAARERVGTASFSTAARHDETGRIVAWSAVGQQHCNPHHAFQGITIVHPEHRGHRLGTIVKIENFRHARRHLPRLRYIDTWNAAVNDFMISINEAMGFRKVEAWHNWQAEI
jgi:GNAT superfamily N-acetyltransferase